MQVLTLWIETVHFTACVVFGFLVICPFVPFDMAKADSEAEFSLAESSNEQNGLSDLNGNLMFHLLFLLLLSQKVSDSAEETIRVKVTFNVLLYLSIPEALNIISVPFHKSRPISFKDKDHED